MVDIAKRRFFTRKKIDTSQVKLPWVNNLQQFTDLCIVAANVKKFAKRELFKKGMADTPRSTSQLTNVRFVTSVQKSAQSLYLIVLTPNHGAQKPESPTPA